MGDITNRPSNALDLPDTPQWGVGHWFALKPVDELTERERRTLRHAFPAYYKARGKLEDARGLKMDKARREAMANGNLAWLPPEVKEGEPDPFEVTDAELANVWTDEDWDAIWNLRAANIVAHMKDWSLPLPLPTLDSCIDLPGPIFDAIYPHAMGNPTGEIETGPSAAVDPDSPTQPSSDSDSGSTAQTVESDASIPGSSQSGTSIGTVDSDQG
jgi:hypothetical protein